MSKGLGCGGMLNATDIKSSSESVIRIPLITSMCIIAA